MISFLSQRCRISAVIFGLGALSVGLLLWMLSAANLSSENKRQEAREEVFLELVANTCRQALLVNEFDSAQLFAIELLRNPHIEQILLADRRSRIVLSTLPADIGKTLVREELSGSGWQYREIANPSGTLGTLAMRFSKTEIETHHRQMLRLAMQLAVPVTVFIGLVAWVMASLLSRRLERLETAARQVAAGRLETRVSEEGNDEIASLGRVFNAMTAAMQQAMEGLRTSETHFRNLFENVHVVALVIDPGSGAIIDANTAAASYYGWSREKLKTMNIAAINTLPPQQVSKEMSAARTQKRTFFEFQHRKSDGSVRDVEVYSGPVTSGSRTVLYSIVHDVTERKRAEENYRALFQKMLDGFAVHEIICDGQGKPIDYRFLTVNPAFELQTGLKAHDIIGKTVLEVMPGTERSWIEKYGRVAQTGEPLHFENFAAELGKHFEVTAFRNQPNQFACFFQDITDRKRAEETLRENELQLRTISNNIPNAMIYQVVWKPDGSRMFTFLSDSVLRFYGVTAQEAMTNPNLIYGCVHEDDRARVYQEEEQSNSALAIFETEARMLAPHGRYRWSRFVSKPQVMADGATCWNGIEFDITEEKRADEERLELQAQLTQAQKMESVGRLAGGVAHDFNNMITIILGYTEMALEKIAKDDPLHGDLQAVNTAARRSADLTRQLLAFARKQTVVPVILDLNDTVESMLKMLRRLIGEDIELVWRPGPNLWRIKIDPSQIDQILANVCVNARDAITGVGTVTIETENTVVDQDDCHLLADCLPGQYVLLTVSDTGSGMSQDILASIFEPFFTTKAQGKGTGLGLATVYGIIRQNMGFVGVTSEVGKGTTFRFYLPRSTEKWSEDSGNKAGSISGSGETILLVEDEPAVMGMVKLMLKNLGYRVLCAATPGEAIRIGEENAGSFRLLMTDVIMPGMNGRDLAQLLTAMDPKIKCLFMSGYTADIIASHGILEAGVHFIQKPFSKDELAGKLRELLEQNRLSDHPPLFSIP